MKRGCDSPTGQPAEEGAPDNNARVVVAVRIRPLRAESTLERYDTSCLYCTAPEGTAAQGDAPTTVTIINPTTKEQTDFAFDRVFDEADGQASVYSELVEDTLVHTMERGGDVTMVAYGQTGSGKTFTMLGERGGAPPSSSASSPLLSSLSSGGLRSPLNAPHSDWLSPDSGVFLRAVNTLMSYRDLHKSTSHVSIYLQAVEIYNDTFIDLLAKGATKDARGWQRPNQAPAAGSGIIEPKEVGENLVLSNALRVPLETLDDVQRCFDISHKNRSVSATNMNDVSSRSHAIFLIELVLQAKFSLPGGGVSQPPDIEAVMEHELQQWMPLPTPPSVLPGSFAARTSAEFTRASGVASKSAALAAMIAKNASNDFEAHPLHICRATLVDLAGSERVKRSGVVGKGMQEAVFVNSSLSTLGLVVHSLCAKQQQSSKHIPFRDSKMTRVLRPSFVSPSARVIFVTNISPTSQSYVETLNSMRFASRLKDLKYSTPPQTSGPSLGLLLNDERLQRLRQQFDEMSADLRIYQMTCGASNGIAATSQRRALVEQAKSPGVKGGRSVVEDLMVRPLNVKEALQRCRAEAAATQEASDREAADVRTAIIDQMMTAARLSGRINEDETELTVDHLRDSIGRMEAELQLTKTTCAADVQQWRDRVESAEVQGDATSSEYTALVKRKRELYHDNIKKKTELDDIDEEATVMRRSEQASSSRLAAEQALRSAEMDDCNNDKKSVNTTIEYLDTLLRRVTASTELRVTRRHLERLEQQQRDATAPTLVAHELSPAFSHRLAAMALKGIFNLDVVRTSEGRHRLLNERLEQASAVFTVSPLAFYFQPEEAQRPTRFVAWDDRRRGSDSTRQASDNDSDDDLVYDEDLEATAVRCASRGPSIRSASGSVSGFAGHETAEATSPLLGELLVDYYLRIMALYGHLMRVTARAEKRKRKVANAPLLSNGEARAVFVILDAVEVDDRVVEDVLRNARRQLDPPQLERQSSAALSPHDLRSPGSETGMDAWDTNRLPAVSTEGAKALMLRIAKLLRSNEAGSSSSPLRFVPCLARCLQALTLISLYEALLSMKLPGTEGGSFQAKLLKKMSKRLVVLQSASEALSQEDAAILKGCQYACRASGGSSGGAWTMEDLKAAEERSRVKERIRVGILANHPSNGEDPSPQSSLLPAKKEPLLKRVDPHGAPQMASNSLFLWTHHRSCDLSPLRGLATKCLLLSQLLQSSDPTSSDDQAPTQPRFLECLLLVLRQGH